MAQLNSLVWEKTYLKSCSTMARFCSHPGYVKNAIGKTIFHDFHSEFSVHYAIWADDEIATNAM